MRRSHDQEGSSHVGLSIETPSPSSRVAWHSTANSKIASCCLARRPFISMWERASGCTTPQPGVAFHVNVAAFTLNAPRWNRHFRAIYAAAVTDDPGRPGRQCGSADGSHYRIEPVYETNTVADGGRRLGQGETIPRPLRRPP